MKEKILDALLYLVENFLAKKSSEVTSSTILNAALEKAGLEKQEIDDTMNWLASLSQQSVPTSPNKSSVFRMFTEYECQRLSRRARGLLYSFEAAGVLNASNRELIIDYAICLDIPVIDSRIIEKIMLLVILTENEIAADKVIIFALDDYNSRIQRLH